MSGGDKEWEVVKVALKEDVESLNKFEVFLKKYPQFSLDGLFAEVDETDYSLADWVDALLGFELWMEQEGAADRPFQEMLSYIHCCTQINPPTLSLASLKVIVNESLTEYGFDGKDASHL